jgi:hypothetical protein
MDAVFSDLIRSRVGNEPIGVFAAEFCYQPRDDALAPYLRVDSARGLNGLWARSKSTTRPSSGLFEQTVGDSIALRQLSLGVEADNAMTRRRPFNERLPEPLIK